MPATHAVHVPAWLLPLGALAMLLELTGVPVWITARMVAWGVRTRPIAQNHSATMRV